jgi:hypothetical protein
MRVLSTESRHEDGSGSAVLRYDLASRDKNEDNVESRQSSARWRDCAIRQWRYCSTGGTDIFQNVRFRYGGNRILSSDRS